MQKLIPILILITLASCAATPAPIIQTQTTKQQIFERPVGLEIDEIKFKVGSPKRPLDVNLVWYAFDEVNYLGWKRRDEDILRYIRQLNGLIDTYEQQVIDNNAVGE